MCVRGISTANVCGKNEELKQTSEVGFIREFPSELKIILALKEPTEMRSVQLIRLSIRSSGEVSNSNLRLSFLIVYVKIQRSWIYVNILTSISFLRSMKTSVYLFGKRLQDKCARGQIQTCVIVVSQ